jgi:hypothetical protein
MDRPDGPPDFVMRWRLIKSAFSRNIAGRANSASRAAKSERGIWQRHHWSTPLPMKAISRVTSTRA